MKAFPNIILQEEQQFPRGFATSPYKESIFMQQSLLLILSLFGAPRRIQKKPVNLNSRVLKNVRITI